MTVVALVVLLGLSACASRDLGQPAPPPYETHPHEYIHPGEPGYPSDGGVHPGKAP